MHYVLFLGALCKIPINVPLLVQNPQQVNAILAFQQNIQKKFYKIESTNKEINTNSVLNSF